MSEISARLVADMKDAMKNKEKFQLSVIRMALAAFKQKEIDEKIQITDDEAINILGKMIKQRNDAAEQFKKAARNELAQKEIDEIAVLQAYLPKPLSENELIEIVQKAILDEGASSIKDMGKIMNKIKAELHGRADMGKVGSIVKSQLS
ncbi:GatB/YqeY domain-containing protein [Facilibium subflavum]|uniref:GatB/YqeY domain-containing protein n=1 Tax=Facilibium subflavum TaxID=2219058 RepID=UPI000E658BDB|nr:GatB/YqeY domain-containing protein [Facilibium subflavum]